METVYLALREDAFVKETDRSHYYLRAGALLAAHGQAYINPPTCRTGEINPEWLVLPPMNRTIRGKWTSAKDGARIQRWGRGAWQLQPQCPSQWVAVSMSGLLCFAKAKSKNHGLSGQEGTLPGFCFFNAGVPTPTAPECGYPGIQWPASVIRNCLTQEHSIALFSSCRNWECLPSLGPKSVCLWLLLLAPGWTVCCLIHLPETPAWLLAFYIPYPANSSQRHLP